MDRLKILIVDDEPLVGDLIRRKLSRIEPRFNISMVEDAYDCLEYLNRNKVDCILSDYQMPGMDGMELLDRLRKSGDQTPFIFVTGQGSEEVAREAFKHGAYDYFTKEVGFAHFDRISNSIHQAVKHHRGEEDRARVENRLDEEKNKLDAIIAGITDGLCMVDRDFMLLFSNQAYKELIGDHVGKHCYDFIENIDDVCEDCPVEKTFRDGKVHRARKHGFVRGQEIFVDVSSSPMMDESGKVIAAVKVVRDVTEHIKAEEQMATSEKMYRLMFEDNPLPMFILDSETLSFLAVNNAVKHNYGYSEDEFLSMTAKDIRPAEDVEDFVNYVRDNPNRAGNTGVWRHRRKNGTILHAEITSHAIDFDGRKARVVVANDVTDRILTDRALRESEAKYRTLMENAYDAILLGDAETGVVLDANRKAEILFGYGRGELIGMHQSGLHPARDMERYRVLFDYHVQKGEALTSDLLALRKDGSTVPIEISSSVVEIGGKKIIQGIFRDVTERKRAEYEKDRLMKGISAITEGIAFADSDGRYIYMNEAHARLFGYTPDELVGKTWRTVVPPEMLAATEEIMDTRLRDRNAGDIGGEGVGLRKDGSTVNIEFKLAGFFDEDGAYGGHVCIARDITERKAMQEKLALSDERYREAEVIARIGNWQWLIDKDEVIWSDGMFAIFGLDPAEFGKTYRSYLDYVHPDDIERVMGLVSESLTGRPLDYTTRVFCPDGQEKVIHVYGRLSLDENGKPARLFGTIQDITERTIADKALRASEERHRLIFETSAVGIVVADPDGSIYEANPAFCDMLGYSEEELLDMSVSDLTYPEDVDESMSLLSGLNAGTRGVIDIEKRYIKKDGGTIWSRTTVTRHHVPGMPQPYTIAFVQDITGRKMLEKQREELFAMLRHDMKTPLAVISGNAEMVISDCRESLDAESLGMIESMKSSALLLTRMLDDLMAISRLESGDITLEKKPVNVTDLLLEASVVASERAKAKGLTYVRDVPEGLPEMLANRSYVQRAVANLLDNAIKYTPQGGRVSLRADATCSGDSRYITVSVSDSGPGIAEHERELVFEKHYRSSRTPSRSGSGLGLSIVKAVAGFHSGRVELDSREGDGSTFRLILPVECGP